MQWLFCPCQGYSSDKILHYSVGCSINVPPYHLCLLVTSSDNLFKQFGPRSGQKCSAWSGSKLFDTLICYLLKNSSKELLLWGNQQTTKTQTIHWLTCYFHSSNFCCVFATVWYRQSFVCVCLLLLRGHLLGKGWPLGSRLWRLIVSLLLSHWYPGSGVVLDHIDSWSIPLCPLSNFVNVNRG